MTYVSTAARQIREEENSRGRLYQALAPIIGAFDASEMTASDIAAHGLKKLGFKVPSDDHAKLAAIDSYLAGRQHAAAIRSGAMDSRPGGSFVSRYLDDEA